jgi:hypothetical protein
MMPSGKRDYGLALDEAWKTLAADAPAKIQLDFLSTHYEIDPAARQFTPDAPAIRKILMLHYLARTRGSDAKEERSDGRGLTPVPSRSAEIGFAQIPGAGAYFAPFRARVIAGFVRMFDADESAAAEAFRKIGAHEVKFATRRFVVRVFPKIDIKVIYWKGDEEMPSEGQIVFDKSVADYLPVEDIAVCCEELAAEIKKMVRRGKPPRSN